MIETAGMPPTWLPLTVGVIAIFALGRRLAGLRRRGIRLDLLAGADDIHALPLRIGVTLALLHGFVLLTYALIPDWAAQALGAVPLLTDPVVGWIGITTMLAGLFVVVLAQAAMRDSWHLPDSGQARPALITTGPYRWSRNPTYLGLAGISAGTALSVPHALSFAALGATLVTLSIQIRLEEAYLEAWLGADYQAYAARVGRWLSLSAGADPQR